KQCDSEAIHAEGDAAGVRQLATAVLNAPDLAEVLAVIVEAHAGGGPGARVIRNQQLELERLLDLTDRHDLADAPEEGIIRHVDRVWQGKLVSELPRTGHPAFAK